MRSGTRRTGTSRRGSPATGRRFIGIASAPGSRCNDSPDAIGDEAAVARLRQRAREDYAKDLDWERLLGWMVYTETATPEERKAWARSQAYKDKMQAFAEMEGGGDPADHGHC